MFLALVTNPDTSLSIKNQLSVFTVFLRLKTYWFSSLRWRLPFASPATSLLLVDSAPRGGPEEAGARAIERLGKAFLLPDVCVFWLLCCRAFGFPVGMGLAGLAELLLYFKEASVLCRIREVFFPVNLLNSFGRRCQEH